MPIIALLSANRLIFILKRQSVLCEVEIKFLYVTFWWHIFIFKVANPEYFPTK